MFRLLVSAELVDDRIAFETHIAEHALHDTCKEIADNCVVFARAGLIIDNVIRIFALGSTQVGLLVSQENPNLLRKEITGWAMNLAASSTLRQRFDPHFPG